MTHIHIGHHFFGAGNLGDDLMLAGFLEVVRRWGGDLRLTCCIPWDIDAMRRRFPGIEWLPYDASDRMRCIAECHAWLGLGDTPFQTSVGDWLLDHLLQEAQFCAAAGKRMYYLGVGVNDIAAAEHPKTAALVRQSAHVWTRDATSATALQALIPQAHVSTGSDLAHVYLGRRRFAPPAPGELAVILNFEDPAQFTLDGLARFMATLQASHHVRWVAQEVRDLAASEVTLYRRLPEEVRRSSPLVVPDYAGAHSVDALLEAWGSPDAVLTSRYHASLVGAWMGSRVVAFPRSLKVQSAITELGLTAIAAVADERAAREAVARAPRADPDVLQRHLRLAEQMCGEALDAMTAS